MTKTLMQVAADNWPEDEAYTAYMDFCLGWRSNPEMSEYDYQLRRQLDIDYYSKHVFAGEPDCAELIARFIAHYDKTDQENQ